MMKRLTWLLAALIPIATALSSKYEFEQVAVIVHQDNYSVLKESDIKDIFLGRVTEFPLEDIDIVPIITDNRDINTFFAEKLLNTTPQRWSSDWSKLVFTGKAPSPKHMPDPREIIDVVASNRGAIGYVPLKFVTNDVRIVLVINKG